METCYSGTPFHCISVRGARASPLVRKGSYSFLALPSLYSVSYTSRAITAYIILGQELRRHPTCLFQEYWISLLQAHRDPCCNLDLSQYTTL